MNLREYIAQVGEREFAVKFNLTPRTVAAYRYGQRKPKLEMARRIVDETPVTWAGITNEEPEQAA